VREAYLRAAPTGYEGTIVLIEDGRKVTITASSDPVLFGLITDTRRAADTGDHTDSMTFAPGAEAQIPPEAPRPATPAALLERVKTLRGERSLREALETRGAVFLASFPRFRALQGETLVRGDARFPFVHRQGHPLAPVLRGAIMARPSEHPFGRPALLNVGVRGSGKMLLLLRALEAIPEAVPELEVARIYVTFNANTTFAVAQGPKAFTAGVLLRVFHAVLFTLGDTEFFMTFLSTVDWTQFTDHEFLLPKLAEALGVQTLVIAIDDVAIGIEAHRPYKSDMETEAASELRSVFSWADTVRPHAHGA
jgi:hypothetical protein